MTFRKKTGAGALLVAIVMLASCNSDKQQFQTANNSPEQVIDAVIGDSTRQELVNPDEAVNDHIRAIETSFQQSLDEVARDFETNRFANSYIQSTTPTQRLDLLSKMREAAEDAGGVFVDERNGEIVVSLDGERLFEVGFDIERAAPFGITALSVEDTSETRPQIGLSISNMDDVLTRLSKEDNFSGVVYVEIDNQIILKQAYGAADPETGRPMTVDTIFGIGSRPIDFTVAGIMLLRQNSKLDLDDFIAKFFDDVPEDKRSITLRHLMTGKSGLPDFHGQPGDWDQDLAWIDRATAEQRILNQPLLFQPGAGESHSHSAFGLLAAIIERVSGEDYMTYLAKNFFEPAGMLRTGEYGSFGGHDPGTFAVGGGPGDVGDPNIPPNWGKTSWLVKGSGGMYSSLDDLLKFYDFVRTSGVLAVENAEWFFGSSINIDGSDRGFELFSAFDEDGADQAFLLVNMRAPNELFSTLGRELESLIRENQDNENMRPITD